MTEVMEAIRSLQNRGVRISVEGERIRVSYRCRASELQKVKGAIATIRAHKPEAIAVLQSLPVTTCPLCGEPYTKPLHAVPESQPETFRNQVIEMRHAWFHRPGALALSSAREEYWRQAIEEAKADPEWARLFDPSSWERRKKARRQ